MSLAAPRAVLRQSRFALRRSQQVRNAATDAAKDTAKSAADTTKNYAEAARSKASEGLSRVSSSAGSAASRVGSAIGSASGQAAQAPGFVGSVISTTTYYSRVGLELGKLIIQGRGMNPPTLQSFQQYMQPVLNIAKNPMAAFNSASTSSQAQPINILGSMRNVDGATMAQYAVVGAEVIGFFTIGEIIGRLKLVGYRSSKPAHAAQATQAGHV